MSSLQIYLSVLIGSLYKYESFHVEKLRQSSSSMLLMDISQFKFSDPFSKVPNYSNNQRNRIILLCFCCALEFSKAFSSIGLSGAKFGPNVSLSRYSDGVKIISTIFATKGTSEVELNFSNKENNHLRRWQWESISRSRKKRVKRANNGNRSLIFIISDPTVVERPRQW